MGVLFYILITTFCISLLSFFGALTLFFKEELLEKMLLIMVAFAAGGLIGGAFFHLIPESIAMMGYSEEALLNVFLLVIFGFCVMFILEQFIHWHHHHSLHHQGIKSFTYLILVSDSFHNFIDGLVIAASFIVDYRLGITTAIVVALHEIPQEIGDYGVLVYGGFSKARALLFNFLSSVPVILGGLVGFLLSEYLDGAIIFLVPFAAGSFIYIASTDLIPEIKQDGANFKKMLLSFIVFLFGISLILLMRLWLNK